MMECQGTWNTKLTLTRLRMTTGAPNLFKSWLKCWPAAEQNGSARSTNRKWQGKLNWTLRRSVLQQSKTDPIKPYINNASNLSAFILFNLCSLGWAWFNFKEVFFLWQLHRLVNFCLTLCSGYEQNLSLDHSGWYKSNTGVTLESQWKVQYLQIAEILIYRILKRYKMCTHQLFVALVP